MAYVRKIVRKTGTFFRLEVDIVDKGSGERVRKSMMWQPTED